MPNEGCFVYSLRIYCIICYWNKVGDGSGNVIAAFFYCSCFLDSLQIGLCQFVLQNLLLKWDLGCDFFHTYFPPYFIFYRVVQCNMMIFFTLKSITAFLLAWGSHFLMYSTSRFLVAMQCKNAVVWFYS